MQFLINTRAILMLRKNSAHSGYATFLRSILGPDDSDYYNKI